MGTDPGTDPGADPKTGVKVRPRCGGAAAESTRQLPAAVPPRDVTQHLAAKTDRRRRYNVLGLPQRILRCLGVLR